jgi:hypothetical protein
MNFVINYILFYFQKSNILIYSSNYNVLKVMTNVSHINK